MIAKSWSRLAFAASCLFAARLDARNVSVPRASAVLPGASAVSLPVPQLPASAPLVHAPALLPALGVPAAPAAPVLPASAHLNALAPQAARAESPSASAPQSAAGAVYDGARQAKAQDAAVPADASSYTSSPADLPLSRLTPSWQASTELSASAKSKVLAHRKPGKGAPVDLGAEETLSAKDVIKRVTGSAPSSLSAREQISFHETRGFEIPGAKQIGVRGSSLLWIDSEGKLNAFDLTDKRVHRYTGPLGALDRFAVAQDGTLFVAGGGSIQRWDLEEGDAVALLDDRFATSAGVELSPAAAGLEFTVASGRYAWRDGRVLSIPGAGAHEAPEPLTTAGGHAWRSSPGSLELWTPIAAGWRLAGEVPLHAEGAAFSADGKVGFAAAGDALYQWEVDGGRYRRLEIPGIEDSSVGPRRQAAASSDGRYGVLVAGDRVFVVDTQRESEDVSSPEGRVRLWSEANPMRVDGGVLRIGDFSFPIAVRYAPDTRSRLRKAVDWVLRRKFTPQALPLAISEKNWRALNLPSNKWNLYQTLRSFSLGQHVMYVGETGGGKTWLADVIAQITNNELWMVSLTEYTRNQDLIARDTFGEEGKNKTGLSMSVVLKWLQNGGILLLDEMHKPLEGIAALNNILQNLEYRMPDGRVIKGDPKKSFVIGTMNPVKPPYKGEPPSGELESRFGTKLRVNYLPRAEEAALLQIFKPSLGARMAKTLVKIAGELRRAYPDVLPLPISSRTLLHIVQEIAAYPNDDPVEIFKVKYNPMALLDDATIGEAIDKALKANDLKGAASSPDEAKKKLLK